MRPDLSMIALGIALAVTCSSPVSVHAEETNPAMLELGGRVMESDVLAGQRGGADLHLSEIRAIGSVSEVEAHNVVTGHNVVSGGALAGASGMPMFIQNSGNGVLIQNAVILNVQVQ
ncbi:MAG: hypothetical protein Q7J47_01300 [Azoarcus sp.]|nr:hypothetical protein [Azoarcus sp.]